MYHDIKCPTINMPTNYTLNFFDPNADILAHHENQLTRAFLVVLRMSPAAHQAWLSLVAPEMKLYNLSLPWSFDTQKWQMFEQAPDVSEPIEGISVIQAADAKAEDGAIEITDRAQVLDGLVRYGDDLLIVIETKLAGRISTRQARCLNVHGAQVRFKNAIKAVDWRELIAIWYALVEASVVAGAERSLIEDFLIYVERHFPQLGPFRTLSECKENASRITMRLNALLDEIAGGLSNPWLKLPGRSKVDRAYLKFDEPTQSICLVVYPADTLTQAQAFYGHADALKNLLSLQGAGWSIAPNFHFGHMARGFVWTQAQANLNDYAAYWKRSIASACSVPREKWSSYWAGLIKLGFAIQDDRPKFDLYFTKTKRSSATPRPGLGCSYYWNLPEARRLDDQGQFLPQVVRQLNVLLKAIDEPKVQVSSTKA